MADTDELANPMQLFDIEMEPEVPSQRVRRPTKRALAMIEDSLPEGPGVLQSDNKDSGVVTPEARPRSPLSHSYSPYPQDCRKQIWFGANIPWSSEHGSTIPSS